MSSFPSASSFRSPSPITSWLNPSGPPSVGGIEQTFQNALNYQPPTADQRMAYGQSRGLGMPSTSRFYGAGLQNGRTFTPAQFLPAPPPPPGTDLPKLPLQALLEDTHNMQGAADRQFVRNNAQISAIQGLVGRAPGQIMGQARSGADELAGVAGRAEALGQQQVNDVTRRADDVMSKFDAGRDTFSRDINQGYRLGDQSVSGFQQAISDYADRGAQDASVIASGIRANSSQQMKMARAGIHPDGTPMTAAEQHDAVFQVERATSEQVQSAVTPVLTQYNNTVASLRQTLASLQQSNAGLRMTGAGIKEDYEKSRGQLGATLNGQILQAHANQNNLMQISAGLHEARTAALNAAQLAAVNYEMQGMNTVAQLTQQNPESVVSWFQGLLALYSAGAAMNPAMGGGGTRPRSGGGQGNSFPGGMTGGGSQFQSMGANSSNDSYSGGGSQDRVYGSGRDGASNFVGPQPDSPHYGAWDTNPRMYSVNE